MRVFSRTMYYTYTVCITVYGRLHKLNTTMCVQRRLTPLVYDVWFTGYYFTSYFGKVGRTIAIFGYVAFPPYVYTLLRARHVVYASNPFNPFSNTCNRYGVRCIIVVCLYITNLPEER